ncbi:uncharacterized protein MYCGRDRAFT_106685 [Zymoseptoria tritici IPO323]|uniref:Uncharacterized protein n=1 Tax=Zymoseptoria tritici (strain CBS 115943 / IPO323) TaxID=336722 RepID=F9XRX3_ZYMTI|nr:uncharacterized protein MYCGRDRAFT_106685 [Zymoseptoria tritici IPO323]EGP82026.1 hypothetical protein MYCGRDRAFT_106685 [Zymoseptoria tritici IPO323]
MCQVSDQTLGHNIDSAHGPTQFELIHPQCGHAIRRLVKHCHFARNDPKHQCSGAWSFRREWISVHLICRQCCQQANVNRA